MSNDIPEAKEHRICKVRQFPNSATFVTPETTSDLPVQLRVTTVPTYFSDRCLFANNLLIAGVGICVSQSTGQADLVVNLAHALLIGSSYPT